VSESRPPTRYVYHRVPPNLRGSVLYPLNQLKGRFPDLYERLQENYATRRDIAALHIPPLGNCLWNDVLFFSPVHPARIQAALVDAGHELPEAWHAFYQVDARLLDPALAVLYRQSETYWTGHFDVDEASDQIGRDCSPFTSESLEGLAEVTSTARSHFASVAPGGRPLLFLGIPHVLYKGQLDTTLEGVSIVEV
jgi:hypothetical protein